MLCFKQTRTTLLITFIFIYKYNYNKQTRLNCTLTNRPLVSSYIKLNIIATSNTTNYYC